MESELLLKGRQRSWEFCRSVEGNGAGVVSMSHPDGDLATSLCKNYCGLVRVANVTAPNGYESYV